MRHRGKFSWGRGPVGAGLLALALLALLAYGARTAAAQEPTPAPAPVNWQVVNGAGVGSANVLGFFPSTIKVRQGDSVTWTVRSDEPHTVTFLLPGMEEPDLFVPGPEPGTFIANPPVMLPSDPPGAVPTVTGARIVGSGLAFKGTKFTARFPQVGSFGYICMLHGPQTGTVIVVPPSQEVPNQAQVDAYGRFELGGFERGLGPAREAALRRASRTARPDGSTLWTVLTGASAPRDPAKPGVAALYEFLPTGITVREGDTVRWDWGTPAEHTVTFVPAGEAPPPFIIPQPQPAGPPLIFANPKAILPSVPAGGRWDGRSYVNSGVLGGRPLPTFELTFTRAGTYPYICVIHLEIGHKGTVTVLPRVALPVTGNAGLAQGSAFPWLGVTLATAGGLLLLGGMGLGLRRRGSLRP